MVGASKHHNTYIWENPVRAGLSERPELFAWSSPSLGMELDAPLPGLNRLRKKSACETQKRRHQVPPLRCALSKNISRRAPLNCRSLDCPGFPVKLGGVGELHAPFLTERRTRDRVRRSVAGNPGTLGMTKGRVALPAGICQWRDLLFSFLGSHANSEAPEFFPQPVKPCIYIAERSRGFENPLPRTKEVAEKGRTESEKRSLSG
jgi:hypothetical protein